VVVVYSLQIAKKRKTSRLFLLNKERISKSFMAQQSIYLLALGLLASAVPIAMAQTTSQTAMLALPDSPGAVRSSVYSANDFSTSTESGFDSAPVRQLARRIRIASHSSIIILPGEQAPLLTPKDKFLIGAKNAVTPFSIAGWLVSSGYSHLTNGPPNYGTDKGAYGQRLGATALRNVSEGFFSTSIMANVFHEDPRYYKMGRGHSITKRALYAATRPIITRTDSGRTTANFALLTGNLECAALTNAYYPTLNHGVSQTMQIFGSSVGGSALGFCVSEFLDDALELVHLKKSE
jgi:hypothetical protein